MAQADIWIDATGVSHKDRNFANIQIMEFGSASSDFKFKQGESISFQRAVAKSTASNRKKRRHPKLKVEADVEHFRLPEPGRAGLPLLSIGKVRARLNSEDDLNFDKSVIEGLKILGLPVRIEYVTQEERTWKFKKRRFPFLDSDGAIVKKLRWEDGGGQTDGEVVERSVNGSTVRFAGNKIKVITQENGEQRTTEIRLGVIKKLPGPSEPSNHPSPEAGNFEAQSNGRKFAALTMCEIQFPAASNEGEDAVGGEADSASVAAAPTAAGPAALNARSSEGGPASENPDENVTRVGDVRSDSVGTNN